MKRFRSRVGMVFFSVHCQLSASGNHPEGSMSDAYYIFTLWFGRVYMESRVFIDTFNILMLGTLESHSPCPNITTSKTISPGSRRPPYIRIPTKSHMRSVRPYLEIFVLCMLMGSAVMKRSPRVAFSSKVSYPITAHLYHQLSQPVAFETRAIASTGSLPYFLTSFLITSCRKSRVHGKSISVR